MTELAPSQHRLKYLVKIEMGQSPPSSEYREAGEGLPFLQGSAEFGAHHPTARQSCDTASKRCRPGDILLSVRAPVGTANVADQEYGLGRGLCALRGTAIDQRYLWYLAPYIAAELDRVAVGSTYKAVTVEDIAQVFVPVPALARQRQLVEMLDAECAQLDRLLETKGRFATQLRKKLTSLGSELVLRGLDSAESLKPSGMPTIGDVPSHWSVQQNKTLIREVVDLSPDGTEELLTVSHITGVTPRTEKDVNMFMAESLVGYKRCRPGDLVINTMWAWMGALGLSRHHGIVSPAYGVYRMDPCRTVQEYYDLLYRTPGYVAEMTRYSKGIWSSRLRLYPEAFLSLKTLVPPVDEQRAIVAAYMVVKAPVETLLGTLDRSVAMLNARRRALIIAAVTGRVDPLTYRPKSSAVAA